MHRLVTTTLATLCLTPALAADPDPRLLAGREASMALGQALQQTLKTTMQQDGPVAAVTVCNLEAPELAAIVAERQDMSVGRTSLQVRNPDNRADAWEQAVLQDFQARLAAGESPAGLEHGEVVAVHGEPMYRYMKAIPTAEVCLICHGGNIPEAVATRIDERYPTDTARGFAVGELRGAFSIIMAP